MSNTEHAEIQTLAANVRIWVDRSFDFIPLSVAELLTDNMLFEHIDLSDYDEDDGGEPPYPMWGTLFHCRDERPGFAEAAKQAGFLVIEGVPEFDGVMLGVEGAGYSFYGAHWIPLYLALTGRGAEFEGVSFDHL